MTSLYEVLWGKMPITLEVETEEAIFKVKGEVVGITEYESYAYGDFQPYLELKDPKGDIMFIGLEQIIGAFI